MAIPSELNVLIERLHQELDRIEEGAIALISIANLLLERFSNNFALIELLAFLNTALFFVEISRQRIKINVEYLLRTENLADEKVQEIGEDLAVELGRILESKIRVDSINNRLRDLQ